MGLCSLSNLPFLKKRDVYISETPIFGCYSARKGREGQSDWRFISHFVSLTFSIYNNQIDWQQIDFFSSPLVVINIINVVSSQVQLNSLLNLNMIIIFDSLLPPIGKLLV